MHTREPNQASLSCLPSHANRFPAAKRVYFINSANNRASISEKLAVFVEGILRELRAITVHALSSTQESADLHSLVQAKRIYYRYYYDNRTYARYDGLFDQRVTSSSFAQIDIARARARVCNYKFDKIR